MTVSGVNLFSFLKLTVQVPTIKTSVDTHMPFSRSMTFRGRRDILDRISAYFEALTKPIVVLAGLGGAGYILADFNLPSANTSKENIHSKRICAYLET